MKVVLVLSLMIFCGLTYHQVRGDIWTDIIEVLVRSKIKDFVKNATDLIILKECYQNLSISNISVGYINHSDLILYGIDSLTGDSNDTDLFRLECNENHDACTIRSNITIPQNVGIKLEKYDLDWSIFDKIPLFGDGSLMFNFKSMKAGVYMNISSEDGFKVDYLELRPHLDFINFLVTGFWNVPEFNVLLSSIVTAFGDIFAVFWELEIDLITCLFSRLLEFLINKETNIFDYVIRNCSHVAVNSSYPIIKTLLASDKLDLMEYISEENILKYAQIASEYLEKEMKAPHTVI